MEQTQEPSSINGGKRIVKKLMEEEVSKLEQVQRSEEETIVNQILKRYRSKDWQRYHSHQLLDILTILNSNRELNLILLQESNPLLANHLQKLLKLHVEKEKCESVREDKFRENGVISRRKSVEVVCAKKFQKENIYQFLWNKIRSPYIEQSTGRENTRITSRIVVLKPCKRTTEVSENVMCNCSLLHSRHGLKDKGKSVKPSYFSFRGMKRKMKCTGVDGQKEQHWISKDGGKWIGGEVFNRDEKPSVDVQMKDSQLEYRLEIASPLKISHKNLSSSSVHFPKRRVDVQMKDSQSENRLEIASPTKISRKNLSSSSVHFPKRWDFGVYLEARRHLSERFSHVEKEETFSGKESAKTLGRILCLQQHDSVPICSPKRDQYGFVTSQMRFSPYSDSCVLQKEHRTSCLSSSMQNKGPFPFAENDGKSEDQLHIFDSKPNKSENYTLDTEAHESICSISDDFSSHSYVKKADVNDDFNTVEEQTTASSSTQITSPKRSTDTANVSEEFGYCKCSRPDSPSESQQPTSSLDDSSPSPSSIQKLGCGDSIYDRIENPSPVSVLDKFFLEDITSPPPSTTTKQGRSNCITYTNSRMQPIHIDIEEQHGYLNWDKLFLKWYSSDQQLSPSFFDELELSAIDSPCDHKLLFDFVKEVISEARTSYISCSTFLSFLKPKLQLIPVDKVVAREIKKRVNQHLLLSPVAPRRLEQIVGEDLASSATWMDIRHDFEDIVVHIEESIIEDLIQEAMPEFNI